MNNPQPLPGDKITLQIDRLSYNGGRGVGRYNNNVVFVPLTAPNETVEVQITETKKNFVVGRLLRIIKASPYRRTPPCKVADRCGGCPWQHVQYSEQLAQKKSLIEYYARDFIPKLESPLEVFGSDNEFRYRHRVQVHARHNSVGYFAKGTNDLVAIEDCHIADEKLFADLPNPLGFGKKFELRLDEKNQRQIVPLDLQGPEFTQVHREQNKKLIEIVIRFTNQSQNQILNVIDLYCGDGNLTFPLAKSLPNSNFFGVEFSESAIKKANDQKKVEGLNNIQFLASDVKRYLSSTDSLFPNTLMVVDPPRIGLGKNVTEEIMRLKPSHIIYVSCNLMTLVRDLKEFSAKYTVRQLSGVDMFPQTEYVESIALISLRDRD